MRIYAAQRLLASDERLRLITSNPGGSWLENKRRYVEEQPRDRWGAPLFASETAWFNRPALIPLDFLRKIEGRMGEQKNVRVDSMKWLTQHMRNNRLPQKEGGGDYVPYIQVDYTGKPWTNEGNHRIMTAWRLGYGCLPVQIVYFTGGEDLYDVHARPPRSLSPALVLECDKTAHHLGYTFDNYATHRNKGDRE